VQGTATAVGPGTANVSATFNRVSGSAPLNVSSATLLSISVTPASAVLAPTTTVNCVARGNFSDGTTQVISNVVTWTSSAPTVASVHGGNVSALSGGSATITAQLGSVSGNSQIVVDSSPLTSIQISPPTASIPLQTGVALRAVGTFADGNTQDLTTFALWTVSPLSVATINLGQATGLETGTALVTALFDGQVGTASLTVTSATPSSLRVSPAASNFEEGDVIQFTALADFSDGTTKDVTPWVMWASSNENVAAITPTGLATSAGAGTTTVTAIMKGLSGTAVVRVH
jgi:trimeric autotransporter adhesin